MKYATGNMGRVFAVRFDHGEDIIESIRELCTEEDVKSAWFTLFGALSGGNLVVGPVDDTLPPDPVIRSIDSPYEVVASGSIAGGDDGVTIHIHGSLGSKDGVLTGCIRDKGRVFIVVECVIFELDGISLKRSHDAKTGLKLIDF